MKSDLLHQRMYHGFTGGMFWDTIPQWDPKKKAYVSRALLGNHDMNRFSECLARTVQPMDSRRLGLPNLKKETVSQAFGMIYERASYNVEECAKLEPAAFFAKMMEAFPWADALDPKLFWKFTYRALMARNIFFECQPGAAHAPLHPMVKYLDQYKQAFYKHYAQHYGLAYLAQPPQEQDPAAVQHIQRAREMIFRVTALYFPVELTCADYQGDGTDKVFVVKESSTFGHMVKNKKNKGKNNDDDDGADSNARQVRGVRENWLREDGSANPYYMSDEIRGIVERHDEQDQPKDLDDDDDDDYDEEYERELYEYEVTYDIYMGRHHRNQEEDTEMSGHMSKLDVM